MAVRGRPLHIRGGGFEDPVTGDKKLFSSILSNAKIYFFTFSVVKYIYHARVQVFFHHF